MNGLTIHVGFPFSSVLLSPVYFLIVQVLLTVVVPWSTLSGGWDQFRGSTVVYLVSVRQGRLGTGLGIGSLSVRYSNKSR